MKWEEKYINDSNIIEKNLFHSLQQPVENGYSHNNLVTNNGNGLNGDYLKDAVNIANRALRITDCKMEFRLYKEEGIFRVKVINIEDESMIKVLPNDMVVQFAYNIKMKLEEETRFIVHESLWISVK